MKTPRLFQPDPGTPTFNGVLREFPVSDPTPQGPTKRQKHNAGKLTGKVWAALCADLSANTASIEVTQEIPLAVAR